MRSGIPAIILAAGASKRMGFPKALLEVGKKTLLDDQIARLQKAGCKPIVVVLGADAKKIVNAVVAKITINRRWRMGQFSSIKCGLKLLPDHSHGCLILPVDTAFVPVNVIKKIVSCASENISTHAVIPVKMRLKGHPVWISRSLIQKVLKVDAKKGRLDAMLRGNLKYVTTKSSAILNNINTKKQWLQLLPRHESPS